MNYNRSQRNIILGGVILAVGVFALLDSMNFFFVRNIFHFWPTLLILFGAWKIYEARDSSGYMIGAACLAWGGWLMLSHWGIFPFKIHFWPLALIVVGIILIMRQQSGFADGKSADRQSDRQSDQQSDPQSDKLKLDNGLPGKVSLDKAGPASSGGTDRSSCESQFNIVAILSGYTGKNNSNDFRGGEITAVMGGVELDLRQASIASEAVLNVFVMWGGVTLKVPYGWAVVNQGSPILGGIDDQTEVPKQGAKRLIIKGIVLMGGLEIKN